VTTAVEPLARIRLDVRGAVQGVGFRPFAFRLAESLGLAGIVRNTRRGVVVEIEGAPGVVDHFVLRLKEAAPPIRVEAIRRRSVPVRGESGFSISVSARRRVGTTAPPPDLALCGECRRDLLDPLNRRFRYPFTACSVCGPRFSIVDGVPYDREHTTLRRFPLCSGCAAEYDNPRDRRFHAQATCCPDCGPQAELWAGDGAVVARKDAALRQAARAILEGKIVAVKGVGGFHLLADARRAETIEVLRQRKRREEKPFAVMVLDRAGVEKLCRVSDEESRLLESPEGPIVLLHRAEGSMIAENVAPGNPELGVFLPTTPLHALLLSDVNGPVVATSGNVTDEPICTDELEALRRLAGIADLFLVHDRAIVRPVEDSVARVVDEHVVLLRRARGYAPGPFPFPSGRLPILAFGGQMKNTIALAQRDSVALGPHGGDLDTPQAVDAFHRVVGDLPWLHGVRPALVAADFHPDYASTRLAKTRSEPVRLVQHHHAHFAACLAEWGVDGPALGIVWDGSGWGPDGTVWGGEFLVGGRAAVRRVAHFRTFDIPGGEAAVRDPRRSAVGLLYESGDRVLDLVREWYGEREGALLIQALEKKLLCFRTSSVGRLFDAVSALVGVRDRPGFEGQAAMALEFAADEGNGRYPFLIHGDPWVVDWGPLLEALLVDRAAGVAQGRMAARFHQTLIDVIAAVAERAGEKRVVLSGGCFQNRRLLVGTLRRLSAEGFEVLFHRRVPTNDGGLALGQAAVVRAGGGVLCV
jgi:hydrogenase maturation protein HypF